MSCGGLIPSSPYYTGLDLDVKFKPYQQCVTVCIILYVDLSVFDSAILPSSNY